MIVLHRALARITHGLPLMGNVSLSRAIQVRKKETDAFIVYRKALGDVVREMVDDGGQITETRAAEIVSEVLQPEIAKLRGLADTLRGNAAKKAGIQLSLAGAVLMLGCFKGLLPSELAALGGASIVGLVDSLAELRANPTAVRNQNLYFLLRLTQ
jgi:hypothetical protein